MQVKFKCIRVGEVAIPGKPEVKEGKRIRGAAVNKTRFVFKVVDEAGNDTTIQDVTKVSDDAKAYVFGHTYDKL